MHTRVSNSNTQPKTLQLSRQVTEFPREKRANVPKSCHRLPSVIVPHFWLADWLDGKTVAAAAASQPASSQPPGNPSELVGHQKEKNEKLARARERKFMLRERVPRRLSAAQVAAAAVAAEKRPKGSSHQTLKTTPNRCCCQPLLCWLMACLPLGGLAGWVGGGRIKSSWLLADD